MTAKTIEQPAHGSKLAEGSGHDVTDRTCFNLSVTDSRFTSKRERKWETARS